MPSRADAAPSLVVVAELPGAGARLTLNDEESHYLTRVCRAREGDRVTATDGRGGLASVRLVGRNRPVMVEVESMERAERTRTAWVLAGAPEGERGDWLVEKLAELGVAGFQPVDCERAAWGRLKERGDRWRRLAVAALRQSRRRFLLEVRDPRPLAEALADLPPGGSRWVGDAGGPSSATQTPPALGDAAGLIGPASGFTGLERSLVAEYAFSPICLSDGRLRTETATMAWACWWAGASGGPGPGDHPRV